MRYNVEFSGVDAIESVLRRTQVGQVAHACGRQKLGLVRRRRGSVAYSPAA